MKPIRLIPAIDIIDGKCVRLSQGDYERRKVYSDDPLQMATAFEKAGIEHLHIVDLDGAKAGKVLNWEVLERVCQNTNLKIDFGGGLRTTQEVERAFSLGINQITGGSIAVKNRAVFSEWIKTFGAEKIILGVDVKDEQVAIHGWQETSSLKLYDFIDSYQQLGIQYVICTDIAKDGMLEGTSESIYEKIQTKFPDLKLIASGGVASMKDIHTLQEMELDGVIFGKAFYEHKITLAELKEFNHAG